MKGFYLQDGAPDNADGWKERHVFIDDYLHPDCILIDHIVAATWLAAKKMVLEKYEGAL